MYSIKIQIIAENDWIREKILEESPYCVGNSNISRTWTDSIFIWRRKENNSADNAEGFDYTNRQIYIRIGKI